MTGDERRAAIALKHRQVAPAGPVTIHAVAVSGAVVTLCGQRPPRGLVVRTPAQVTFFGARPDRCLRCWAFVCRSWGVAKGSTTPTRTR